jgi:hypothetical protein
MKHNKKLKRLIYFIDQQQKIAQQRVKIENNNKDNGEQCKTFAFTTQLYENFIKRCYL